MRISIYTRLWISHFLAVLLVSGSIGTYFYFTALDTLMNSIQGRLLNSAALLSRSLDATRLDAVRGPGDVGRPEYRETLRTLRDYAASNADIAFIYVMRREADKVFFVVDSDPSPNQALPGTEYRNATPGLWNGFTAPSVDADIASDPWGHFLSGYAPLKNGDQRYLLGLDMRADEVAGKLRALHLSGLLSLLLSVALALLFSRVLARHFLTPVRSLIAHCRELAAGRFDTRIALRSNDELDQLITAFNTMAGQLSESRERAAQAHRQLQDSRDRLEIRVRERTADLERLNDQLLQQIEERRRTQEALQAAARTDYLTGLLNRRAMLELMAYEAEKSRRGQAPFCVVVADIDHFKDFNDRYGHELGDRVLARVAQLVKNAVRGQDSVARWGGEELLLLLPDTPLEGARRVAEKIRGEVENLSLEAEGQSIRVTLSLGLSVHHAKQSLDDCIRRADAAMYRAKRAGRNRVVADSDPDPQDFTAHSR